MTTAACRNDAAGSRVKAVEQQRLNVAAKSEEIRDLATEVKDLVTLLKGKAGTALTRLDSALVNVRAASTQPVPSIVKAQLKTAETDIVKAKEAVSDMVPPADEVDRKADAIKENASDVAKGAEVLANTAKEAVVSEEKKDKQLQDLQDDWFGPRTWWWIKFVRNVFIGGLILGVLTFLATTLLPGGSVLASGVMASRIGGILRWLGSVLWRILLAVFHVVSFGGRVFGKKLNAWWDDYYAKRHATPSNPNPTGPTEVPVRTGTN